MHPAENLHAVAHLINFVLCVSDCATAHPLEHVRAMQRRRELSRAPSPRRVRLRIRSCAREGANHELEAAVKSVAQRQGRLVTRLKDIEVQLRTSRKVPNSICDIHV